MVKGLKLLLVTALMCIGFTSSAGEVVFDNIVLCVEGDNNTPNYASRKDYEKATRRSWSAMSSDIRENYYLHLDIARFDLENDCQISDVEFDSHGGFYTNKCFVVYFKCSK